MEVTKHVKACWYPDLILPDNWDTDEPDDWHPDKTQRQTFDEAQAYCKEHLAYLVERYDILKAAIKRCEKEGYVQLIHHDEGYQARWLALMQEGYLVSKPFLPKRALFKVIPLNSSFTRRREFDKRDIPDDPRILEPYVMRGYYFLESVGLDEEE